MARGPPFSAQSSGGEAKGLWEEGTPARSEALPAGAALPARGAWPARLAYIFHPVRCLGSSAPSRTWGWRRGLCQAPTLLEAPALGSHLPGLLCTEVCTGHCWSPAGVASPPGIASQPRDLPDTFESSQQARLCPSDGLPARSAQQGKASRTLGLAPLTGLGPWWALDTRPAPRTG